MDHLAAYWIPWTVSNTIALILLWIAFKRPRWARLLFVLLFAWACWINYVTAHNHPSNYLNYAALTPVELYREFINGWFKQHITAMVTLISIGQGLIALGFLLKRIWVRIAGIGAIVFFIAIAPLGIGSGFPSGLIAAVAVYFILKKDDLNYPLSAMVNRK